MLRDDFLAQIPHYKRKWADVGRSLTPANPELIRASLAVLYRSVQLPPPQVEFFQGPERLYASFRPRQRDRREQWDWFAEKALGLLFVGGVIALMIASIYAVGTIWAALVQAGAWTQSVRSLLPAWLVGLGLGGLGLMMAWGIRLGRRRSRRVSRRVSGQVALDTTLDQPGRPGPFGARVSRPSDSFSAIAGSAIAGRTLAISSMATRVVLGYSCGLAPLLWGWQLWRGGGWVGAIGVWVLPGLVVASFWGLARLERARLFPGWLAAIQQSLDTQFEREPLSPELGQQLLQSWSQAPVLPPAVANEAADQVTITFAARNPGVGLRGAERSTELNTERSTELNTELSDELDAWQLPGSQGALVAIARSYHAYPKAPRETVYLLGLLDFCAYVDFCVTVLGCQLDCSECWEALKTLVAQGGVLVPLKRSCYWCDRPLSLQLDEAGLAHAVGEPAVLFGDGCAVYYYHGVQLPEKYGQCMPEQWQSQWVLTEETVTVRRVLIEGIGYDRLCQDLKFKTIDTWQDYTLLQLKLPKAYLHQEVVVEEPIRLLKKTNAVTGQTQVWRSPGEVRSARIASQLVDF